MCNIKIKCVTKNRYFSIKHIRTYNINLYLGPIGGPMGVPGAWGPVGGPHGGPRGAQGHGPQGPRGLKDPGPPTLPRREAPVLEAHGSLRPMDP